MNKEDLDAKPYRELVNLAKKLGVKANGKKEEIIDRIVAHSNDDSDSNDDNTPVVKKIKSSTIKKVDIKRPEPSVVVKVVEERESNSQEEQKNNCKRKRDVVDKLSLSTKATSTKKAQPVTQIIRKDSKLDDIFFTIWRDRCLQQKIFLSTIDYVLLKNLIQLDKQYSFLSKLNNNNIPVAYHIKDLDHYHIYNAHQHKSLITHIVVSSTFYQNHLHLIQQQQKQPILFGISISSQNNDPVLNVKDLPNSIQYYQYKNKKQQITKDLIPQSITSLDIEISSIKPGVIPNRVKTLVLGLARSNLDIKCFPKSLTSATIYDFCFKNTHKINLDLLPPRLLYLNLTKIEGEITGNGPKSLKYFVGRTEHLDVPSSVTQLKRVSHTNLNDVHLPPNLTFLGNHYPINFGPNVWSIPENTLSRLKALLLDNIPHSCITKENCPPGILYYRNRNYKLNNHVPYIPSSATKVSISICNEMERLPIIPSTVTDLAMENPNGQVLFTKSIKNGYFANNIVKLSLKYDLELTPGIIPSSVTDLKLIYSKPIKADIIPPSVVKLCLISRETVKPIILPNSITSLSFENDIQVYSDMVIPKSVETLKIFNQLNFQTFPFQLFKNITRLNTRGIDDAKSNFIKTFGITTDNNYNEKLFPSNIKLVEFRYSNINYYIIDKKVYKEENHVKNNHFIKFDNK
ncbi:hypothetical protein CYY_007203 [Polysphondylium violaceum]|uniref:SAP domain-containing protein n=1 Tax=Polysphondylium violaceum TaxID=133409 RepID=A0A8J4PP08_9MYCE|nr:hypothetical protein CYY_007203 [Polysphondylium violaceum]